MISATPVSITQELLVESTFIFFFQLVTEDILSKETRYNKGMHNNITKLQLRYNTFIQKLQKRTANKAKNIYQIMPVFPYAVNVSPCHMIGDHNRYLVEIFILLNGNMTQTHNLLVAASTFQLCYGISLNLNIL